MKTTQTLDALENYLQMSAIAETPMRDDEFTTQDVMYKSTKSYATIARILSKDVAEGRLTMRKLSVGGKQTNVYSIAK